MVEILINEFKIKMSHEDCIHPPVRSKDYWEISFGSNGNLQLFHINFPFAKNYQNLQQDF